MEKIKVGAIMEKIKVSEFLKGCPKGMELDCTMYEDVYFDYVDKHDIIHCYIQQETHKTSFVLNQYGTPNGEIKSKCVIFPKGKTTWEGFQRPYINGDIVYTINGSIAILGNRIGEHSAGFNSYCGLFNYEFDFDVVVLPERLATKEEKEKLFDVIKANGYKWDEKNKTLEKLIVPQFKVGDRIRTKKDAPIPLSNILITEVNECSYDGVIGSTSNTAHIHFKHQDKYELVPDKFDINTLKPFDKVLVRTKTFTPVWTIDFYDGYQPNIGGSFTPFGVTGGKYFQQCIPYEGNEHLRGTTNDCDKYFKNWE